MNNLKLLPLYIVTAFFSGAALLYFQWAFYKEALTMAFISVPVLILLSRKQIPVFMFGVLLLSIGYAVQQAGSPLTTIGTYSLLSIFQFSLWSTVDGLKGLNEEIESLKHQRLALLHKEGVLKVLSLQEFVEQAFWLLKTNSRRDRTWLMEVVPTADCLAETERLERAVLSSISKERDLVTSKHGAVYLLVKETEQSPLIPFLKRLEKAMDSESTSTGYEINRTTITKVSEMGNLLS